MTVGRIILLVVTVLLVAGVGQRVLDGLRLTDRQALAFIALILIGGLIPDIPIGDMVRINIGGALIPFALCVYVFARAGSAMERARSVAATLIVAVGIYALGRFLPAEPEEMPFDINYAYGIIAGVVAYAFGRSRRCAFLAGVSGMLLADIGQAILLWRSGVSQTLRLGGAGILDTVVLSGLVAVLLAEGLGEFFERVKRGAKGA